MNEALTCLTGRRGSDWPESSSKSPQRKKKKKIPPVKHPSLVSHQPTSLIRISNSYTIDLVKTILYGMHF